MLSLTYWFYKLLISILNVITFYFHVLILIKKVLKMNSYFNFCLYFRFCWIEVKKMKNYFHLLIWSEVLGTYMFHEIKLNNIHEWLVASSLFSRLVITWRIIICWREVYNLYTIINTLSLNCLKSTCHKMTNAFQNQLLQKLHKLCVSVKDRYLTKIHKEIFPNECN